MKVTTLFSCSLTTVFLSSIKADHCNVYNLNSKLQHFVLEGQPLAINCLLSKMPNLEFGEHSLTWYQAGHHTPVLEDPHSRIQQQASSIWFLPAVLEDSGSYECAIRNSTHCSKMYVKLTVFRNSNGSCFNAKFAIPQSVYTSTNSKIVCPNLNDFRNENHLLPVLWYKDCKLIKDRRFQLLDNYLMIANTTMEDQGNYTCHVPFNYMGKQYNVSRDISLQVTESPPRNPPEIFSPRNHSVEVKLGSNIIIDCNTSGAEVDHVFWTVNDSYIDHYYKHSKNVFEIYEKEIFLQGKSFLTVRLNISKVSDKEYENVFVCHALNSFGQAVAHVMLRHKGSPRFSWTTDWNLCSGVSPNNSYYIILHFLQVSDGKTYDAFVLYPTTNAVAYMYHLDNFVLNLLPEVLEQQCGYKLFIVGRDDIPGQAVVSITEDTIQQSRRLMIILEPELSSCSRLEETSEQHIAMYNALVHCGIKVILIEMEKIEDYTNMPESIKYIKQKHGAIQWKKNFAEESQLANTRFWKNVRYRMPPRRTVSLSEIHLLPQVHSNPVMTITR
ncbi:interleukin-1 receptor type 1-like isoform X2 [Eublepharis macularius]|uniref:Interleukin-1 receptor type 1-like isoform X2 n=1 Tax=Eublepharis macularius TaxID=481883 RepID=A0AA97J1Z7_EUBMA|nr:interleukin-1 receptor type 1-like isoform X2 [Eublepharis macularius]